MDHLLRAVPAVFTHGWTGPGICLLLSHAPRGIRSMSSANFLPHALYTHFVKGAAETGERPQSLEVLAPQFSLSLYYRNKASATAVRRLSRLSSFFVGNVTGNSPWLPGWTHQILWCVRLKEEMSISPGQRFPRASEGSSTAEIAFSSLPSSHHCHSFS